MPQQKQKEQQHIACAMGGKEKQQPTCTKAAIKTTSCERNEN